MPVAVDLTETEVFTAVRAFVLAIMPDGVEVIRGQVNRVAAPKADDYVVMTAGLRARLANNIESWDRSNPAPVEIGVLTKVQLSMQIDVHGPESADNAQVIATLFRSSYGCEQFKASGLDLQPLYVADPKQVPFVSGEQQYEPRWVIDAVMQANINLAITQDFADVLAVNLIDVDATYPPGG